MTTLLRTTYWLIGVLVANNVVIVI